MHRSMFHASDPAIRPYNVKNIGFCRFGGVGDFVEKIKNHALNQIGLTTALPLAAVLNISVNANRHP